MQRETNYPDPSQSDLIRLPMLYVKNYLAKEYMQLVRNMATEWVPAEGELNPLKASGNSVQMSTLYGRVPIYVRLKVLYPLKDRVLRNR